MKTLNIGFDIDGTLWAFDGATSRQVPNYDLIQVLRWFANNDHNVYVWSAGGLDYAQQIVDKLGLSEIVEVIPKNTWDGDRPMDIAFDDQDTELATVDIKVNPNQKL